MNKIYEKNLKALKRKYIDIYEKIDEDDEIEYEFELKTQEIDNRLVTYLEYPDKVMQLESLYDNDLVNEIWTNNVLKDIRLNTKVLIFGIGNLSFIYKVIEKTNDDAGIYIYEPNLKILKSLMEFFDITDIINNKRCKITIGTCMKDSFRNTYEAYFEYTDVYNFINLTSLNYNSVYKKEHEEYEKELAMALSTIASNFGFYSNSGKYSNDNIFKNLPSMLNSKSLDDFGTHIDKDIPAIIVAAGPSLSKNIKYLKDAKGKAIIIAIDASMRALAREGITPDICVTVDFNKELGHFDEGDSNSVPMICSLISTASFVANSKGTKMFFCDDTPYINKFISKNNIKFKTLPTGGTVANNALSAAINMGCKTIIIIGQDLAYSENRTHAEGTVKGDIVENFDNIKNKCYVEDLDGNQLLTCGEFVLYKQWIEETVKAKSDIHFINATEGGAGLKGCEHITLKEAIDRECNGTFDINAILAETEDFMDANQKKEFIKYISKMPEEFLQTAKIAKDGAKSYSDMIALVNKNNYHSAQFIKLYKNAKRLNKRVNNNTTTSMIYNEIQHDMNENMKTIYNMEDDEKTELIAICTKGKESFERIGNSAEMLAEKVRDQVDKFISEIQ